MYVLLEAAMLKRIFKRYFKFAIFSWDLELSLKLHKNKLRKKVIKTTLIAIPLALLSYGVVDTYLPPHDFLDSQCFSCHVTIPQAGDLRPYRFMSPINKLCLDCHTQLSTISHYSNASIMETYEVHFPVTDAGSITCATCHDPHMPATDPATGKKTYFPGRRDRETGVPVLPLKQSVAARVDHAPSCNGYCAWGCAFYRVDRPGLGLFRPGPACIKHAGDA